jgi:hypothetical protein
MNESGVRVVVEADGVEARISDIPGVLDEHLIDWCVTTLGAAAIDPSTVRLVLADDFVASVNQRIPGAEQVFDLRRNDGMVGAKTMDVGDDRIDVLVPAGFFNRALPGGDLGRRAQLVMRTLAHEGNHVAMMQAGEGERDYPGEPWARRNYLLMADQTIGEYRAEAAVPRHLRDDEPGWVPAEVMLTLQAALTQITTIDYQQHLDVGLLCNTVLGEVLSAWKVLGVHLAQGGDAPAQNSLWEAMAAPHWETFTRILTDCPDASVRVPAAFLLDATETLAGEFRQWLGTLGFAFRDSQDGSEFRISDWSLFA